MTELEAPDSNKHLIVLPGFMALNARITVMVLAKTVETATVNTKPNATCWRTQVAVLGWPMKRKEQRKHGRREMSRIKLRAWLLALTTGESWCFTKIPKTAAVWTKKHKAIQAMVVPKASSKARNVTCLGRH